MIVRGKHDRRVPIKTILFSKRWATAAAATPGIYFLLFACAHVGAHDAATLRLRNIDVGIVRMIDDIEPVAKINHAPIIAHDSGGLARAARSRPFALCPV